jgi:hypothetical protein
VNGLEAEGMGEHEVDARGGTGIGEPIPAEHALGADGQIVAIGRDEFEEKREVIVFDVGVDQFFAGAFHDADIHLAGVQINSAVEFSGGRVILHSDHSVWGRETPVNTFGYAGKCSLHFLALFYANKKPTGLKGEYQVAGANPMCPNTVNSPQSWNFCLDWPRLSAGQHQPQFIPVDDTSIVSLLNNGTTQVLVQLSPVRNAMSYQLETSMDGGKTWVEAGISTQTRRIVLTNLVPVTTYEVRARAIGGSTGASAWTGSSSIMST